MISPQLALAELGFKVFPCVAGCKNPLTDNGLLDATTDEAIIEAWSKRWPNANWAIRTDGLLVVDVDGAENEWFKGLGDKARELAVAHVSLTPHGGRHFVFRAPEGARYGNTQGTIAHKVDTRANGGYIVVAPSVVDGKPYKWLGGEIEVGPWGLPLPPQWILDALTDSKRSQPGSSRRATAPAANRIPESMRNKTLFSLGCGMRAAGMSKDAILAALIQENETRCKPPLDLREVESIADSASLYDANPRVTAVMEHHAEQIAAEENESQYFIDEPEALPSELLRVPGFVSEVMDYCLATAPYPNVALAFCGALCLQAVLAGRKVRDPSDNRTNLYLLGLAHSAAGKDWPRKLNTRILGECGMLDCLGDKFSSGEGIQDALYLTPAMLFQNDEIDGLLQTINKSKDARYEGIMSTLLTLNTSANSIYPMRRKAGQEEVLSIDQPCLVMFGTAVPGHYYDALSGRMLTNGFLARWLTVESGKRQSGQDAVIIDPPAHVLETAKWWEAFNPGNNNLGKWHPDPAVVPYTDEAKALITEARKDFDVEYSKAEDRGDAPATTVWGRANEHTRKLALVYAVSESHKEPKIGPAAVDWARKFVTLQSQRMLFNASLHVADNPFHELCQKLKRQLAKAPERALARSQLLKRLNVDSTTLDKAANTLTQQGDVAIDEKPTAGRPATWYTLLRM